MSKAIIKPGVFALASACLIAVFAITSTEVSAVEVREPGNLPPALAGKPTGAWAKADMGLRRIAEDFRAHAARGRAAPFVPSNGTIQHSRGRVVIDAVATGDPQALLQELLALGLENGSVYGSIVSGLLPLGAVDRALP